MSDRMDELKGNLKEGAGKLTGNRAVEAEGDAQADAAKARRESKGAMREVGGKVKEGVGDMTGTKSLEAEGKADQARGKAEKLG